MENLSGTGRRGVIEGLRQGAGRALEFHARISGLDVFSDYQEKTGVHRYGIDRIQTRWSCFFGLCPRRAQRQQAREPEQLLHSATPVTTTLRSGDRRHDLARFRYTFEPYLMLPPCKGRIGYSFNNGPITSMRLVHTPPVKSSGNFARSAGVLNPSDQPFTY